MRRAQQGVRHRPVAAEHGVLERAEVAEPRLDEVGERGLRLGRRGREAARAVVADQPTGPSRLPPVEVGAHLGVDVVLLRPERLGQAERRGALRRRVPVVVVVVPAAALGLVAAHEDAGALAHASR